MTPAKRKNPNRLAAKKGAAGERLAEFWFARHGWKMVRTQPETRVISNGGQPRIINCGAGGVADYTGYRYTRICNTADLAQYVVCEVKSCSIFNIASVGASILRRDQREWMDTVPPASAHVFIMWGNGDGEMYQYIPAGSYVKGKGKK